MTTSESQSEPLERYQPAHSALELQSQVRCVRCSYDLRGVSIRSVCSECGLPVRTTILAMVDPRAAELAPIEHPKLVITGVLLWAHGLLIAFVFVFLIQFLGDSNLKRLDYGAMRVSSTVALGLCAIGAFALVRPHRGLKFHHRLCAAAGVVGLFIAMRLAWVVSDPNRVGALKHLHEATSPSASFYGYLVAFHLTVATSVLLLRANARILAARSVLMRSGVVNRQTLAATACVMVMAALGQTIMFVGLEGSSDWLIGTVGVAVSMTSGLLLVIAGFGLAIDSWRLGAVLLEPPVKLSSLLGKGEQQ